MTDEPISPLQNSRPSDGAPCRRILLVRHGQSTTNAANVFTGWSDPPLTELGVEEARGVASALRAEGIAIDAAFTSGLKRAIRTAQLILWDLGSNVDLAGSAALNERDYGELTGLNKTEVTKQFGASQVEAWRRSYAEAPPSGESLRDTAARVLAYYVQEILPATLSGGNVLVVAHGNSLRALVMALDCVPPEDAPAIEIGTGAVIAYELASDSRVMRKSMLIERIGVN